MTNYSMKTLEIFLNIYISSDENESILSSEALSQFYYKIYFSKKKKKKKRMRDTHMVSYIHFLSKIFFMIEWTLGFFIFV